MTYRESEDKRYLDELEKIGAEDAAGLKKAQESYGNSWKLRGGIGAFMMLARKWDRLELRVKQRMLPKPVKEGFEYVDPYDIFAHILADPRGEGVIDDVRDLRRYLMLVEAELRVQAGLAGKELGGHRDNEEEKE